jgi:transposase-like protein
MPDITAILEAEGIDTRHQQNGKMLCPKCDTYHITVSHGKGIAKCWACNWTRTEHYVAEPYQRNWVAATLNAVRDTLLSALRSGKENDPIRKAAVEYLLHDRKLDWRVIVCSPIGLVPQYWDIAPAIAAGLRALALQSKIWENEPDDSKQKAELKADFDQQKTLLTS